MDGLSLVLGSCYVLLTSWCAVVLRADQVTTGGTTLKDDIMRLYNVVHILVGTPGRVLDLADKGIANLKECNTLVMDEVSLSMPVKYGTPLLVAVKD